MRQVRFVGLTADGGALVVERDGEHLLLGLDDEVRSAVAGQVQMPMPLATSLTPREIQRRIRTGESATRIATECGVPVEQVARFEGPVLAEREHHAAQARRVLVGELALGERVAALDAAAGTEAAWDAWLGDDGSWRVRAAWPDGRLATWAWEPATRRLRPLDAPARQVHEGRLPSTDDLEAVLRPVAAARQLTSVAPLDERSEPAEVAAEEPGTEAAGTGQPDAAAGATEGSATQPPAAPHRRRRASVPSWEQIAAGRPRRDEPPSA